MLAYNKYIMGFFIDDTFRVVWDHEDPTFGFLTKAEYFDCDMDISRSYVRARALYAFNPFNKNPKNMFTTVSMGLRQIYAYLMQFPRVEKCGIHGVWSQSRTNPTKEIDVILFTCCIYIF